MRSRLSDIKLLLFDGDGAGTDGTMTFTDSGTQILKARDLWETILARYLP